MNLPEHNCKNCKHADNEIIEEPCLSCEYWSLWESPNTKDYYKAPNGFEAIDIIDAYDLGFHLGNAIKYILRAGKKPGSDEVEDIKKAIDYLTRYKEKIGGKNE